MERVKLVGSVVVGRSVVLVGHDIGRCSPGASGSTFCLCRPEIPMKFSFSEVTPAFTNPPTFTNPPAFTDPTTFRDSPAPQLPPASQYPRRPRKSGKVWGLLPAPPLRTVHETFALTRLKPYFKLSNLDFDVCTCL